MNPKRCFIVNVNVNVILEMFLCLQTKLGYAQTFFPFMCLLVGVLLALVSVVAEKMPWISSQRRKLKERDVDRLKYMLQQKTQLEKDIDFLLKTAAEEDSDSN